MHSNVCLLYLSTSSIPQMDKKGELTGDDVAYIYPDMRMAMKVREMKKDAKLSSYYRAHLKTECW